jgi:hypothetical protein
MWKHKKITINSNNNIYIILDKKGYFILNSLKNKWNTTKDIPAKSKQKKEKIANKSPLIKIIIR